MAADPTVDFDKIGRLAFKEIERRLKDGARDLPGTGLMQFANNYAKYLADKAAAEPPESDVEGSAFDAILDADLPVDRTRALLRDLLARLDEDRDRVLAKLEELA